MSTITTYTGREVDPFALQPGDVNLRDVSQHLSMQCRFLGAIKRFYSVAEHCVLASRIAQAEGATPREQMIALLHDSSEAYLGDIVTPVKARLRVADPDRGGKGPTDPLADVDNDVAVIVMRLLVPALDASPPTARELALAFGKWDKAAYAVEDQCLRPGTQSDGGALPYMGRPLGREPEVARRQFEARFQELLALLPRNAQ